MHEIEMWLAHQRVVEARARLDEDRRARAARRGGGQRTVLARLRGER
jgi:hypothetical protein